MDSYVKAIVALLDSKGIESATMIGYSFAGTVLCALARIFPQKVATLVFLSALIPQEGRPPVVDITFLCHPISVVAVAEDFLSPITHCF
jgi:pimeloyl-ACP methyl ester carboxylesterase